jgi:hypothetical protein
MSTPNQGTLPRLAHDTEPRPRQGSLLLETLLAPRRAFERIQQDPHWLLPLGLFTLATFVHTLAALPVSLERVNEQIRSMNPNLESESLLQSSEISRFVLGSASLLASLVTPLLIVLITAGLVHLVAILLRGDLATSGRAVFSAVSFATVPLSLAFFTRAPLIIKRGSLDVSLGLDALLPHVAWPEWALPLLQFCDGFRLWFVLLLTVGAMVLYRLRLPRALAVAVLVNVFWFGVFVLLTGRWSL